MILSTVKRTASKPNTFSSSGGKAGGNKKRNIADLAAKLKEGDSENGAENTKMKKPKKQKLQKQLLSFGDDEEEDDSD